MAKQNYAIIVAGGSGMRMGKDIPKQFITVNNKPILMHTIEAFYKTDNAINFIVVLPEAQHSYWNELVKKYNFTIPHRIAKGGDERFFSVKNGLKLVEGNGIVAVHDGVRPLVSSRVIKECYKKAELKNAVIPTYYATESIRKINDTENISVNRTEYFMVQTPQVFKIDLLKKAYEQGYDSKFTDDASIVESLGYNICCIIGNPENLKITRPMDLIIAEALLKNK